MAYTPRFIIVSAAFDCYVERLSSLTETIWNGIRPLVVGDKTSHRFRETQTEPVLYRYIQNHMCVCACCVLCAVCVLHMHAVCCVTHPIETTERTKQEMIQIPDRYSLGPSDTTVYRSSVLTVLYFYEVNSERLERIPSHPPILTLLINNLI